LIGEGMARVSLVMLTAIFLASQSWHAVLAQGSSRPPSQRQCPTLPQYIATLSTETPDLGGGAIFDEDDAPVEQLGSSDCPSASSTQCEKLTYLAFMFALLDMTPQKYRRPGISAFLANIAAEDSSLGDKCSAENVAYNGNNVRAQFPKLAERFCSPSSPYFSIGQQARLITADGQCDTSDAALDRLKRVLVQDNQRLSRRAGYLARYTPIVVRMYRYNTNGATDEDAYLYRGRGFIQITGKANYMRCQADVKRAAKYLATHSAIEKRVRSVTGIDWSRLDVVETPEAVSQNRYIAAFCAASYWNSTVVSKELLWTDEDRTFAGIVRAINPHPPKVGERLPSYKKWCNIVQCKRNTPQGLDWINGFKVLTQYGR
jgi:predicted chitinase